MRRRRWRASREGAETQLRLGPLAAPLASLVAVAVVAAAAVKLAEAGMVEAKMVETGMTAVAARQLEGLLVAAACARRRRRHSPVATRRLTLPPPHAFTLQTIRPRPLAPRADHQPPQANGSWLERAERLQRPWGAPSVSCRSGREGLGEARDLLTGRALLVPCSLLVGTMLPRLHGTARRCAADRPPCMRGCVRPPVSRGPPTKRLSTAVYEKPPILGAMAK